MTTALDTAIRRYAATHADADGLVTTPIEGLTMMCIAAPTGVMHAIYKPVLCLVLGGAKQLTVGSETRLFSAGQSVIVCTDVPVIARVVAASRIDPYLAVAIGLDMAMVREVAALMPPRPQPIAAAPGAAILRAETDEALLDGARRLVRLLDQPEAVPVLLPAILREVHYWLLAGPHGAAIRRLAAPESHATRIARAVAVLRADFARPLPVERLAATAGMSASSFHQHFKASTSLSPRQFQKQLRLMEARRLMVGEGLNASGAALAVGYESVSQFTRDYGRLFGASPRRDRSEQRAAA